MTRLDWIVLRRIGGRVALTLAIFFGLFSLVESLDTWRFTTLSGLGGPQLAVMAIVSNAVRSIIGALPVIVLIGAIVGVLDLQARREMVIIKIHAPPASRTWTMALGKGAPLLASVTRMRSAPAFANAMLAPELPSISALRRKATAL